MIRYLSSIDQMSWRVTKLNAFASTLDEKRNQPACVAFADKAARYLKNK